MARTLFSLIAMLSLLPAPALAASDSQFWTTGNVSGALSPDWRLSEEIVARFSDNRDGLYEIESVTSVAYKVASGINVAAGYVHNPLYSNGNRTAMERRAREQISFDSLAEFAGGKLSARFRAEQRWRDHVDGTGWRIRPYVKYSVPIAGKTAINLSHESFVNLNRTSFQRTKGYDRMRNLVSITVPVAKRLTGEVGYLNQHGFVRNGPDSSDHVAYFGASLSL